MGETVRVGVAGVSPGGLSLARAFGALGLEFDLFERDSGVGGIPDGICAGGKSSSSSGPGGGMPAGVAEVA